MSSVKWRDPCAGNFIVVAWPGLTNGHRSHKRDFEGGFQRRTDALQGQRVIPLNTLIRFVARHAMVWLRNLDHGSVPAQNPSPSKLTLSEYLLT
jgi:hypothetical protein